MPGPLVPDDDLYARLEVAVDASPEAIELAWRALLKQHHPDVAGDGTDALDRAKRINVAHDWLSDPALRSRYDADRLGAASGGRRRRPQARLPPARLAHPVGPPAGVARDRARGRPSVHPPGPRPRHRRRSGSPGSSPAWSG